MLWWLSFAASGSGKFLGVVVTEAATLANALAKTHALGLNPSGEVLAETVNEQMPLDMRDRLLSAQELEESDTGESALDKGKPV